MDLVDVLAAVRVRVSLVGPGRDGLVVGAPDADADGRAQARDAHGAQAVNVAADAEAVAIDIGEAQNFKFIGAKGLKTVKGVY